MATRNWAVSADAVGATNGSSEYGGDCDHLPVGYMSWLGGAARAFLKFTLDWSGVVQITKAELKIRTTTGYHGSIGASNTCYVDLVTSSWSEGTSGETWVLNQQPDYSESVNTSYRATFTARSDSTWYTEDITAIVNRWAPSSVKQSNGAAGPGTTNNGIRIISSNEGNSAYRTEFHAREAGTSDAYIVLTYTTNQVPTVQSYTSPIGGATITDDTPTLNFTLDDPDAADTVVAYDVQVDDSSAFGSPAVNLTNQAIGSPANTVAVAHTCTALARGFTYYWRALGRDNQGGVGAWGATQQFYLAHLPGVDTLSPTANAYATIHNLGDLALWTDGSYAKPRLSFRYTHTGSLASASYRVQVWDAASGGNQVADTGTVAWVAAANTTKVVDLATAMPRNTSRWWEVTIVDSAGGTVTSARQQFRVNWGQALYEANPGAGSAAWDFDLGTVTGGSAVAVFRTASQSGAAGSFGTVSSWNADIGNLTPAAWVNVLVRMAPTTAGVNVTLGSMVFRYLGSSTSPDNWSRNPTGEWSLSTSQRRFGAKSLKCSVTAGATDERWVHPYRQVPGDDIPVVPGVTYTWSAYVNAPVPLTGGELDARVYANGFSTFLGRSEVIQDTTGEPDGWVRLVFTYTVPAGITLVRPVVYYHRLAGVTEVFYVDGAKHEEGPVATPWQAGGIGAVILDSGGVVVDQVSGGTLRLRAADGTALELGATGLDVILPNAARGLSGLGSEGVEFGGDTALTSPLTHLLDAGASGSFASQGVVTGGGGAGTTGYWGKVGSGTIPVQYAEVSLVGTILGLGDGGDDHGAALVYVRVKQQVAFGGQPSVFVRVTGFGGWTPGDVAVFVTSVAGPTTFQVWVRTQAAYQHVRFAVQHLGLNSATWTPESGVALQSGTPSGTAYYGSDALSLVGVLEALGGITGVPLSGQDPTFTITGGGTATYTTKWCDWVQMGRLVVFSFGWTVNAAGSGTTDLSIASGELGLPATRGGFAVMGDRGGTGVVRLIARFTGAGNITSMANADTPGTPYTGSNLASGATWSFTGAYITNA